MAVKARSIDDFSAPMREYVAVVAMIGLLALTLLGPAMTILSQTAEGGGNSARQAGYVVVCLLTIVAMRPLRHPERLMVIPWPLLIPLGWCWLSMTWAIDPDVGARRLILTTVVLWSVFALVRLLGYERSLLIVRISLIVLLTINFLTSLIFPLVGVHQSGELEGNLAGDWRGIMAHKNLAGLICALTIILFSFDRRRLPYWAMVAPIVGAGLFLILSGSKTSIGLIAVALTLGVCVALFNAHYALTLRLPRYAKLSLALVSAGILAIALHFGVQSDTLLNYISDSTNLTGRTQIWVPMVRYYFSNPWFGSGYGSFWNINAASPIEDARIGWLKDVSQGHNGFLDLLVTIGLPGLIIVLSATFLWPLGRLLGSPGMRFPACAMIAATILFCIAHNGTESSLFDRDSIGQVFLILAIALLQNHKIRDKRASRRIDTSETSKMIAAELPKFNDQSNRRARLPSAASRLR